jgi:hypothetical protein
MTASRHAETRKELAGGCLLRGLAQSVALGAYSGALIALLHDRLAGADAHVKATSVRA